MFAALVRRHAALVLGVCRRVLGHAQNAENTFQAVLCVLAHTAGAVRRRSAVGGWRYAVAYRIASWARATRAMAVGDFTATASPTSPSSTSVAR